VEIEDSACFEKARELARMVRGSSSGMEPAAYRLFVSRVLAVVEGGALGEIKEFAGFRANSPKEFAGFRANSPADTPPCAGCRGCGVRSG
jgi:hypothetical protein